MNFIFLRTALLIFFFALTININAQSDIYVFGMGGVNYIPMKNYSHFLNQFSNNKIDEVGFSGIIGIKYSSSDHHLFLLSVEFINKNASYFGGFGSTTWNFNLIPIAIGYQYLFSNSVNKFRPFAGINISYSFIEIKGEYQTDTPPPFDNLTKKNNWGIEPNFGFSYQIVERFFLLSEIKYRYMKDIEFFFNQDINLSGLVVSLGIQIKFH